ncbi:MAG: TolC family protein [Bacteroidetes bacterium]|nr:TolC family protein [Bacteroidota bacterium]
MKKIIVSLFALFAVACVGPKYSRPEVKAPGEYTQSPAKSDSITDMKWWDVFQDTVLQGLIKTSLTNNRDLLAAMSRVDQSRAVLGYNKANLGPTIDYNLRARATDFGATGESATVAFPTNSYAALGMLNWEIDIWGRLRHANRAAYAEMMASDEDRKSIYISLIAMVADQYFSLRGTDERLLLARKTLESRREYARILALRFEKGEVSELDKLQADQVAFAAEAQVYNLERQQIVIENSLNVLLGRNGQPIKRGLDNESQIMPVDIPQGLPSQLLERRPDIRYSEQKLIAQTERVGTAVAVRFPMLSLTGFLGIASPELSTIGNSDAFVGSITGQLAGPIFHFNQNRRRVEVEREGAKQAAFQYEQTVLNAFAEVENSLAGIRTYRSEYQALSGQVNATAKTLDLSKQLYDNGYTSFLQVLDAERQYYDAQYQKSLALQNHLTSTVNLYKALGGGW